MKEFRYGKKYEWHIEDETVAAEKVKFHRGWVTFWDGEFLCLALPLHKVEYVVQLR